MTDEELIYANWLRTGGSGSISYWRSIGSPLYYTPPPEPLTGWIRLDSRSIYVLTPAKITEWVQLDSRTISVLALTPITDWIQLDEASISIIAKEGIPWLWIAGGIGAVGLAVYAMTRKKTPIKRRVARRMIK